LTRPNILFIHTDQQRWDTLAANGNSVIRTPNLDRLAAEGTNFDHAFAQNPVCMPSRVSVLTGQYCSALRITHMAVTVPEDTVTLPAMLRNYGYHNALIGKLHFLPHSNRDHREVHPAYGFHHLELSDEPGCRVFDVCARSGDAYGIVLYEVYDDRSAFDAHLASSHFKTFDAASRDMVTGKRVTELTLLAGASG